MNQPIIKRLLYVLGIIAALIALTLLFLLVSSIKKQPQTPPVTGKKVPADKTTSLVKNITPPSTVLLPSGTTQTFLITLDPSLDPSSIKPAITASSPSNASAATPVAFTTSLGKNTISLTTTVPIEQSTTYLVSLSLRGTDIFRVSYLSSNPTPTIPPKNNPTLSAYLPYETLSYRLEFDKELNTYIMHFKYDIHSKDALSVQFNTAKQNVNEYIKSKGIDPSTIVIRYLYK